MYFSVRLGSIPSEKAKKVFTLTWEDLAFFFFLVNALDGS